MSRLGTVLSRLAEVVASRRSADPSKSWSARLLADRPLAAKKLAEEAVETAIAAVQGDKAALIAESADLIYHWLVVLEGMGVSLDEVAEALEAHEGTSGVAEKASRDL